MALWVSCDVELDDVRVERSLREEIDVAETRCLLLEHADERRTDATALLLGVDDAGERVEELVRRVHMHEPDMSLGDHHVDHALALATTEQPVVDKDARQLIAHRAVHERGGDGRVDAAAQRADHLASADLAAQRVDGGLDERVRLPGARTAAHVDEEVAQDLTAQRRVRHLEMKLDAVTTAWADKGRARRVE